MDGTYVWLMQTVFQKWPYKLDTVKAWVHRTFKREK